MRSASERKMSCFSLPRFQACQKPLSTSGRNGRAIARRGSLGVSSDPRKGLKMTEEFPFRGDMGGLTHADSTNCRGARRKRARTEDPAPIGPHGPVVVTVEDRGVLLLVLTRHENATMTPPRRHI